MPPLHNRVDARLLRERAEAAAAEAPRTTLSFYRYVRVADPAALRDRLYAEFERLGVLGRVYVATEGINAQASVPTARLGELRALLDGTPGLAGLRLNVAVDERGAPASFFKLIVRVRDKIVADGLDDATFDPAAGGEHLDAAGFNALAARPDAVVVDMRNHYESEVGHFAGALTPAVDTFRESLPVVERLLAGKEEAPVLMYCTGGIRCEKASAWFRHRGFRHVYQLDGGIINYAREVAARGLENRFRGRNFVFDERLSEAIGAEVISHCHQCGAPCDRHVNCANDQCHLLFLQCGACAETFRDACSTTCADFAELPRAERRAQAGQHTFNGQRYPNAHYRGDMGELVTD